MLQLLYSILVCTQAPFFVEKMLSYVVLGNDRLCRFLTKKTKTIYDAKLIFSPFATFFVPTVFFDQVPNKDSALENPCQSWTKMEESRLWGAYLGCVHCKSHNLLQPSLVKTVYELFLTSFSRSQVQTIQ